MNSQKDDGYAGCLLTPIGLKAMPLKAKTTTTYRIKLALNSTKLTKIAIFTKKD